MTEPKKSDHWNSLLDEIGVPASQERTPPPAVEPLSQPAAAAAAPPPRPRAKPEPKPALAPAKKSSWTSLLGALGLAAPEEPSAPPPEPVAKQPPAPEPPAREIEPPPRAAERSGRVEREERAAGNLLDEFKPRYKPEEPPFPSSRRRDMVDDVAMDIDLDSDFAFEVRPEVESEVEAEPTSEANEGPPPQRRDDADRDERSGRRRRRRRRGGRRREGEPEAPQAERPRERTIEEMPVGGEDLDLDIDVDLPSYEPEDEPIARREEFAPGEGVRDEGREEGREDGGRRRRRRRGRGGRDRDEARPAAEARPSRRPERGDRDLEAKRARVQDEEEPIESFEDEMELDDDEDSGEHAVHKKIPTWAETVGILVDANIAARSSRQPDRGRSRRPRRGDR